ncbi:hypothetical protein DSO57_1007028 [Entomophthora muscae]|uniref:Uncharacterized protein n=1 Tax=Entomophthora muscae TaxID=34485 RepID=A0ACC2RM69_9FUNG|nr:hypothetical protein DSO57_1007028 [Entomophthora muscae]
MGFQSSVSNAIINPTNGYSSSVLPTPFDRIITTSSGRTLAQIIQSINSAQGNRNSYRPENLNELKYLVTTDRSMAIELPSGQFFLETNIQPYKESSSVSHVHAEYISTHDYLMAKNSPNIFAVPDHMRDKQWETSPIGPKTLGVLKALGYKINQSPSFKDSLLSIMHEHSNNYKYDGSSSTEDSSRPTKPLESNPTPIQGTNPPKDSDYETNKQSTPLPGSSPTPIQGTNPSKDSDCEKNMQSTSLPGSGPTTIQGTTPPKDSDYETNKQSSPLPGSSPTTIQDTTPPKDSYHKNDQLSTNNVNQPAPNTKFGSSYKDNVPRANQICHDSECRSTSYQVFTLYG